MRWKKGNWKIRGTETAGYESVGACQWFVTGAGRRWTLYDAHGAATGKGRPFGSKRDACIWAANNDGTASLPDVAPTIVDEGTIIKVDLPEPPAERLCNEMESLRLAIGTMTHEIARLATALAGLELAE